ncbi:UDP-N-acetylglucosamine 2-epimerase (non-hydrolyzing), partial [Clostridium perfringens]
FESIVCVTAQHREMLDSVLDIFNIKPQYDLDIMAHGQTIVDISNKVLNGVDEVIKKCSPDIVLVHGDTSTTLNGALAAFYNKVPVGHVEAGLRSYDIYSPFPEEANRKLTGVITNLHFAPTKTNESNLLSEGISNEKIYVTGNTVIDALLSVVNKNHIFEENALNKIDFENKKVILLTTHR